MILFSMISCKPEKLNTHRLDLMPKIHTSYLIWPPGGEISAPRDKGEYNLVPRVSLLCLPSEAEKRDPGNEVGVNRLITDDDVIGNMI